MTIDYDILPEHMRGSARAYVERGHRPGDFLGSVLANNLSLAAAHADQVNREALFYWARWLHEIPYLSWGNAEKVQLWQRHKGLEGLNEQGVWVVAAAPGKITVVARRPPTRR